MSETRDPRGSTPQPEIADSLGTQLEAAEARLRFVLGLTDGVVFELDADGRYLGIWTGAEELLPVPRDVALGRTMEEVFGPQAAAPFLERLQRTLRTGEPDRFEYSMEAAGRLRWFSAETVRDPHSSTVIFLMRDITQQKLLEQRLIQADRLTAMGTLAAGVAHEVNNPLSYVTSNLNFISEGVEALRQALQGPGSEAEPAQLTRTVDECLEALSEALEGTVRIQRVAGNLKMFARGYDKSEGRADVQRALEASLGIVAREMNFRARLVQRLEPVPAVRGNEARLEQVFLNLLINATQAIPEGAPEQNEVSVHLYTAQGQVVVEIRDTGAGMSTEMLRRVFDPFFSTRPVGAGTGLGLSISHGIITGMGGDISVESAPGRGTCFRIRLPTLPEGEDPT
ncbi:MAG: PAS domain-containing protein [Myxococcaceae bacterium]|nr:PAS domain-containing protein [Myxococcaceae bacterium]